MSSKSVNKYNHVIDELQNYMFSLKNINKFINYGNTLQNPVIKQNTAIKQTTTTNIKQNTSFTTSEKDKLFWILYVMKNGIFAYDMCSSQRFSIEQQTKFDYIKKIRENKDKLKAHKVKSISELETDLANNKQISLKTFSVLCLLEELNIIYVDGRKFYELTMNDNQTWFLIKNNSLEMDITKEKLDDYKLNYYQLESLDKIGLKSMSGYKVDDLVVISKKLNIQVPQDKKITKQVLYELIVQNF